MHQVSGDDKYSLWYRNQHNPPSPSPLSDGYYGRDKSWQMCTADHVIEQIGVNQFSNKFSRTKLGMATYPREEPFLESPTTNPLPSKAWMVYPHWIYPFSQSLQSFV
jgi:hypothetical protein